MQLRKIAKQINATFRGNKNSQISNITVRLRGRYVAKALVGNNITAARIKVIPKKYWNPIKEGNTFETDKSVLQKTAFTAATTATV